MRLNEIRYDDGVPVDGYGPGFFRVGGQVQEGNLLILPGQAPQSWAGFGDADSIVAAAARLDILFLGTGADIAHPDANFLAVCEAADVGVEPMSSPTACRTYNVLLSEGRRVGLAAICL